MSKNADRPWISNYPPLQDWLDKIDARCQEQLPIGDKEEPVAYLEKWVTPTGRAFVVEVQSRRMGWNIYTDANDGSIAATLADAATRLGL